MSRPDHISDEAYEWAEIFMDAHRGVEDDRELLALAFMDLRRVTSVGLTRPQIAVANFLSARQRQGEPAPSHEEIAAAVGLCSKSAVNRIVHQLQERGVVTFIPHKSRSIALVGRA
jgi:DNA-binding MarR family transcriptional regulator